MLDALFFLTSAQNIQNNFMLELDSFINIY